MSAIPDPGAIPQLLPSGTVTFAFTDIEGSTLRWDHDEAAMREAVRRHDTLVRATLTTHGGYVFKTVGDAFCSAFSLPEDAVAAMLSVQRALAAEDFSAVGGLRVRAAIHTGSCDERDGDYFGPAVNRVARLLSIGHGGQVLISGVTSELVQGALPAHASLRSLGEHRLKDLSKPESVHQLLAPDLPNVHPPLRSLDAHPNNLPAYLSAFIGREREIGEITALLREHRLVTLVGSGGIGKTRTSLQVAANLLDGSGDGVWFIELAALTSGEYILGAVARELGVTLAPNDDPLEGLIHALRSKETLLLFDNCEHLIDEVARVVVPILRVCPKVSILATSRQAIGIAGEQTYRLPSLDLPVSSDAEPLTTNEIAQSAAVALFVERARALDRRFTLTDENAATVADICRRLDGIPLAIELAAARVTLLSPRQLRDRLDERFRLLTRGSRNVLPRQQTLRALIDWSHDLLAERERVLFRRVGIFVDGFSLEGAAAVGGGDDLDEFEVFDVLASLVDKSLVLAEPLGDRSRYRLLESTRAYAIERLRGASELEAVARRRAAYFATFVGDGTMIGPEVVARIAAIETELENLREVLAWSLEERHDVELGARLAAGLGRFWSTKLPREGHHWLELARSGLADGASDDLAAGVAYAFAGVLPHGSFERIEAAERALALARATRQPRLVTRALSAFAEQVTTLQRDDARAAFAEALDQAREFDGRWDAGRALAGLATIAIAEHDISAGRALALQAIAHFEALGATDGIAYVCIALGDAEYTVGNLDGARELTRRARAAYGELQNSRSSACASVVLASYAHAANDLDAARCHARDALALLRTDKHPLFFSIAIEHVAQVATRMGDPRCGAVLQGYADNALRSVAHARSSPDQWCHETHLVALTQALGAEELAQCAAEGALLPDDQALQRALAV